ncbi:Hypothetical protein CINCED_3A003101 [Cinara cedri]|uniref:GDP-D-glucose phosphorylase 1 n=1 Tax=Cinara cedri TaxID=506608 RepID=A0A5E4MJZ3_9HEMI|nr:Hypothetical protein CINCED_3A003101 [Cinara cedri]
MKTQQKGYKQMVAKARLKRYRHFAKMFQYNNDDFIYTTSWKSLSVQSKFDEKLKCLWREKEEKGLFRYTYKIEKLIKLPGKYEFPAVLNTDRGTKRRKPITFASVLEPFNEDLFNFTKVNPEEYLFKFTNVSSDCFDTNDTLAINASPLGDFHSLILPKINCKFPQVINECALNVSIQLLLLSASPTIRVGFNSLCAFASVNHLHLHLYYLPHKMYLETCDIEKLSGPCYTIVDFPSKGFVFILKPNDPLSDFVKEIFILVDYLQKNNIPHNIYITRALNKDLNTTDLTNTRNCVRVFVWARYPSGDKCMDKFAPATCELFGHLVFKDKSEFSEISEHSVSQILTDVTESSFLSIVNDVKNLYLNL